MLLIVSVAASDVVYLRDGRRFEGTVTRDDENVTVKTNVGTLVFPVQQVLVIDSETSPGDETSCDPDPESDAQSTGLESEPVTPQEQSNVQETPDSGEPEDSPDGRLRFPRMPVVPATQITMPECMAFMQMRVLAGTLSGTEAMKLRKHVDAWRAFAHDRRRRVGTRWLMPQVYARRRASYEEIVVEAMQGIRRFGSRPELSARRKAESLKLLKKAPAAWADPLLSRYLRGVYLLLAEDYQQAQNMFALCVDEAPTVPGFRQGRAMALIGADRGLDAVHESLAALRLMPDSSELAGLLEQALSIVPGHQISTPAFREAADILAMYDVSAIRRSVPNRSNRRQPRRSRETHWVMDTRPWQCPPDSLPMLTYDRIVVRQAPAVPVGESVLMVDASILGDAIFVSVKADDSTYIGVATRNTHYYRNLPIALIYVPDARFTPVVIGGFDSFPVDEPLLAWGVASYAEMDTGPRQITLAVKPDANGELVAGTRLLPGEALSPIIHTDGNLVGFLSGRTNVKVDGGGDSELINVLTVQSLERAIRDEQSSSSRRRIQPKPVEGRMFVVQAVHGERLGS